MRNQRTYTDDFKRKALEDFAQSGMSRAAFARSIGIPPHTLDCWVWGGQTKAEGEARKNGGGAPKPAGFRDITAIASKPQSQPTFSAEVNGVRLEFPASMLGDVLGALR